MSFSADTDYWGFADTNIKLQSNSSNPTKTEAQCMDSNGDVAASSLYDSQTERSCTYKSCSDTALVFYDTATAVDFRLGKVIGGYVITGIDVSTSNTDRPDITISGRTTSALDAAVSKYAVTELEIAGTRKATAIGASVDSNSKLTSSSVSISGNVTTVLDSDGVEACLDVYGGRIEATNDYVGCAGDPVATSDIGWTTLSGGSEDQENTGYATGSITVFKNLTKM